MIFEMDASGNPNIQFNNIKMTIIILHNVPICDYSKAGYVSKPTTVQEWHKRHLNAHKQVYISQHFK
jgi:predicted secreted protein